MKADSFTERLDRVLEALSRKQLDAIIIANPRIESIGGSVSSICKTLLSGRARWNAKQTDHVKEAEWNKQTKRFERRRGEERRLAVVGGVKFVDKREERRGEERERERRRYRRTLEQARIELKNGRTRRIEAGRRGARWVATKWTSLVGG